MFYITTSVTLFNNLVFLCFSSRNKKKANITPNYKEEEKYWKENYWLVSKSSKDVCTTR